LYFIYLRSYCYLILVFKFLWKKLACINLYPFILDLFYLCVICLLDTCSFCIEFFSAFLKLFSRVAYSDEDLHSHLCRYLDSVRLCWCGGYCFRCCVPFTSNVSLHRLAGTVSAVDQAGRVTVPIRSFLCSPQCLIRFQKNPHAYWKKWVISLHTMFISNFQHSMVLYIY